MTDGPKIQTSNPAAPSWRPCVNCAGWNGKSLGECLGNVCGTCTDPKTGKFWQIPSKGYANTPEGRVWVEILLHEEEIKLLDAAAVETCLRRKGFPGDVIESYLAARMPGVPEGHERVHPTSTPRT